MGIKSLRKLLSQRKSMTARPRDELKACLSAWDLTSLGVGSTLGAGIYVITGVVAHNTTGPAILVSFAIAGFASILAGLSYAEFGARVPQAGSAYVYSYVTVGELLGFITGWNLILEYIIGAASVARAWTGYLDSLVGGKIIAWMRATLGGLALPGLGGYLDVVSFGITILLSAIVGFGVSESTRFNKYLTIVNLSVVSFVVVAGLFYADPANWRPFIPPRALSPVTGVLEYGVPGVFTGAATCFYAYIGFDVIATTAEEAKNPSRSVPIGIIGSLLICSLSYMAVSAVVTLMVPYQHLSTRAPLAAAFSAHGLDWAQALIAVGALCGLSTSLMASVFPLPRIVYSIARDGLLFQWLATVNPRTNTPLAATALTGGCAASMALIFDITALANMMSIGTLMSYSLVSACVLILRFRPPTQQQRQRAASASKQRSNYGSSGSGGSGNGVYVPPPPPTGWLARVPSAEVLVALFTAAVAGISLVVIYAPQQLGSGQPWALLVVAACAALLLLSAFPLFFLPQPGGDGLPFKCPLVPALPLMSLLVSVYLTFSLDYLTWVRFAVWLALGLSIYFGYGIRHSVERKRREAAERRGSSSGSGGSLAEPLLDAVAHSGLLHPPGGSSSTGGGDDAAEQQGQQQQQRNRGGSSGEVLLVRSGSLPAPSELLL